MADRLPVPLIPRHAPDDMLLRLELLRDEAAAAGCGTLAYLIEVAMIEARRISDEARREAETRAADPRDLWRPARGREGEAEGVMSDTSVPERTNREREARRCHSPRGRSVTDRVTAAPNAP